MSATAIKEIQRQVTFSGSQYSNITDQTESENKRLGNVLRKEKIHIQDMIPILVDDGLKFRNGEIYTPVDREADFTKDERWVSLRAKAEVALETFFSYQNKLLAKKEEQ